MIDLREVYLETLRRCEPARLMAGLDLRAAPRSVLAIGKSAGALLEGVAGHFKPERALALIPRGYPWPGTPCEVMFGGHPIPDEDSFHAGREALDFVAAAGEVLFLISGGGSACADLPLEPWFDHDDVIEANRRLVESGLPIASINIVRKHLSAIKGGRLAAATRQSQSLILSDVSPEALSDVASGPTLPDVSTNTRAAQIAASIGLDSIARKLLRRDVPETIRAIESTSAICIADNETLIQTAAEILQESGVTVRRIAPIEDDVEAAATILAGAAASLGRDEVLVTGGEPTVVRRGAGRGGRCIELAVRFARSVGVQSQALFASSDGVDGNSGFAGMWLTQAPTPMDRHTIEAALARSDSMSVAARIGVPIMIPPTGNNLRDLFLVSRISPTMARG